MWIALLFLGIAAAELTVFRFGSDSREPGDWQRVDLHGVQS